MSCRKMVTAVMDKFKSDLDDIVASVESAGRLTPEMAAKVEKELGDAAMAAAREGYRAFIESFDVDTPVLEVDGEVYRRKLRSSKKVMTLLGDVTVKRHLYQRDRGGVSHAPVDTAWGMAGERATPHVREAVLFAMAHLPPVEVVALLEKSAWFHPSTTLVKRETVKAGDVIEAGEESLMTAVRAVESAPPGVRCITASLDGVNVLLNEPGKPKGRPRERPYSETGETGKTSYRNAMVAAISFYGEVPEAGHSPVRLDARYVARMPEKKAPTFKHCFEEELKHTEDLVAPEMVKLLLVDAGRVYWRSVEPLSMFRDAIKWPREKHVEMILSLRETVEEKYFPRSGFHFSRQRDLAGLVIGASRPMFPLAQNPIRQYHPRPGWFVLLITPLFHEQDGSYALPATASK